MKVTVTDNCKREYPYLGEFRNERGVTKVLFTSEKRGIMIESSITSNAYLFIEDEWDEEDFIPIRNKTITIEV